MFFFLSNDGKEWKPSKNSKVCSQHFVGGFKSEDPRSPAYNPSIFNPMITISQKAESKEKRYNRYYLKETIMINNRYCITSILIYSRKLKREKRSNLQIVIQDESSDNAVDALPTPLEPVIKKSKAVCL